jgi:L-lactate dehydrogenase complex protein LldE
MLTCLCDAYYGEVGIATVKVLEHLGCAVEFDSAQTCCGQPAFNSGDWEEAKKVAARCKGIFTKASTPIVAPSASCVAMVREGYHALFGAENGLPIYELAEFIVHQLGIDRWDGMKPYPHRCAFHQACHGRSIHLGNEQRSLLESVPEIELVEFASQEQCCGFGGSFCVTQGKLSSEIGLEKLHEIQAAGATEIVSGDMGCLLHLNGLIMKNHLNLRTRHFAEVLAEVAA